MGKVLQIKGDSHVEIDRIKEKLARSGLLVVIYEDENGDLNIASLNCRPQEAIAASVVAQSEFADEWRGLI